MGAADPCVGERRGAAVGAMRAALAIAMLAAGCAQSVQPNIPAPLDAAPYSRCEGASLGSAYGDLPGAPCNENTECSRLGYSTRGPETDRAGICTLRCVRDSDCPVKEGFTAVCDYPVTPDPMVPKRCLLRCAGARCPEGSTCSSAICFPNGF